MNPFAIAAIVVAVIAAGASYIQAKKAQKKAKEMSEGVEANIESNSKEIPVVYGERRVGGVRVYIDTSRDRKHKYLYMVLAMAEGEVESITDVKIDDIPITDDRFITSGNKQNLWYDVFTGTDTQTVSTLIKEGVKYDVREDTWEDPYQDFHDFDTEGGFQSTTYPWYDNHRLQGVAYLALKFKWDEKAYTGIPDVTALVKGKKVYDPRTQTTAWSANPALCIRDYLTNERYGKGLPASAIDDVAFAQSANDCDDFTVTPYNGATTTTKLFEMHHVVDTSKKIIENVNDMLLSCRAFMPYASGKYSLKIDQTSASVLNIGSDEIISGIAIAGAKKEDRFNQVKVNFFNKNNNYKEDQAIYPEADSTLYQTYLAEDEGEPLIDEVDIFSINNYYTARDMARLILERSRQNMTISFMGTSELINLLVGDVVSITHPTPAWTDKLFQVQEVTLNFDGTVQLTCIEYDANLYIYDEPEEEQPFVGTRLPDPNQVDPISNLELTSGSYIENDGKTIGYLDIDWDTPDDALVDRYEVKLEYSSKTEVFEVATESFRYKPTQDTVSYTVSVRSVNGLGIRSNWVEANAIAGSVDTDAPSNPSGFSVNGGFKEITLGWTNPTENDFDLVTIKRADDAQGTNESVIASLRADSYTDTGLSAQSTKHYWIKAVDRTGNETDYVYMGSATTDYLASGDFADGVITIDFLDQSTQDIVSNAVNVNEYNTQIQNINNDLSTKALDSDFQNVTQELDDSLTEASERLLRMSLFASEQTGIMRDAGITVDPDNGSVSIQAVEALRTDVDTQFASVGIDIDVIDTQLSLTASRTYVSDAIAEAQLSPAEFTAFSDLNTRVEVNEGKIDVLEDQILLRVTNDVFDPVEGRVEVNEGKIQVLQDEILLKATKEEFDEAEERLRDAELSISVLDIPSITQTVIDQRSLFNKVDANEINNIGQLLSAYKDRKAIKKDLSYARTQISADVSDARESIATQRTELVSLIDNNSALLIAESQTRATENEARVTDITNLRADLTTAEQDITAKGEAIEQLEIDLREDLGGDITAEANRITDLSLTVNAKPDTYAQDEAPANPKNGDIWIDTDNSNKLYRYENAWVEHADSRIDEKAVVFAQDDEPTAINEGDLWIDTNAGNLLHRWNGDNWVYIGDSRIAANATGVEALNLVVYDTEDGVAALAQKIVDLNTDIGLKASTYAQDDEPTDNLVNGDLWIDTNDGNKVYRYDTDAFVAIDDTRIQELFNTRNTTYSQDDAPSEAVNGDLWIDTNDGNKLYRYQDGWVSVGDSRIEATANGYEALNTLVRDSETGLEAIGQDLNILSTQVGVNTGSITEFSEVLSGETQSSARRLENLIAQQASTQLKDILNANETKKNLALDQQVAREDFTDVANRNKLFLFDEIASAKSEVIASVDENRVALATTKSELTAQIDQNVASIIEESVARADADSSFSSQLTSITNRVVDVEGGQFGATNLFDYVESEITSGTEGIDSRLTTVEGNYATVTVVDDKITDFDESIFATGIAGRFEATDDRVTSVEGNITAQASFTEGLSSAILEIDGVDVQNTYVQPTAPIENATGDLWYNDSILQRYQNDAWATVDIEDTLESDNPSISVYEQEDEPTGNTGDLWFKIPEIYVYRNDSWSQIQQVQLELRAIFPNNKFYYTTTTPSRLVLNDVWFDTDDGNKAYRWSGSAWEAIDDSRIAETKTTVTENTSSINGIRGSYGLSINNNGTVSGFGLVSDLVDGETVSSFVVSADQFSLTNSTTGELWTETDAFTTGDIVYYLGRQYEAIRNSSNKRPDTNPEDWTDITKIPFVVYTTDQNITKNGTSYNIPAGVYINDAFIQNASIGNAQIQNLAVDTAQIANLAVQSGKIDNLAVTTAKINSLAVTGAKIDNLAVTNAKIANLAVSSGKIDDLAVTTLKIQDNAVTIPSSAFTTSEQKTGTSEVVLQELTYTSSGAPAVITFSAMVKAYNIGFGNNAIGTLKIYRGTTLLHTYSGVINMPYNQTTTIGFTIQDDPSEGSTTYYVKGTSTSNNGHGYTLRSLSALEVKK